MEVDKSLRMVGSSSGPVQSCLRSVMLNEDAEEAKRNKIARTFGDFSLPAPMLLPLVLVGASGGDRRSRQRKPWRASRMLLCPITENISPLFLSMRKFIRLEKRPPL